jgi:hypothetical protein
MPWVLGNVIGAWGVSPAATTSPETGMAFVSATGGQITKMRWYRVSNLSTALPTNLRVWDAVTGTQATPSVVPDNGAVGWQEHTLAVPVPIAAGREYRVSISIPNGNVYARQAYSGLVLPDYPIYTPANAHVVKSPGPGYPNVADTGWVDAVDAFIEPGDFTPPTSDISLDVANQLADWLSLADETHGADNIVKLALDILQAEEGIIQTVDAKVEDVQTWFQGALGIEGNFLTGALRVYLDGLKDTIDLVQAQVDLVRDTDVPNILESTSGIGSGGRPIADTSGVLDPGYVLTDTKVGVGADTWDVPADRYVFTITNPGDLTGGMTINGVPFFRHRGRWAPLEIDLIGHYYPLLGEKHLLYESGRRLPGVLLYVEPYIEWTLEAFDYVPPAP